MIIEIKDIDSTFLESLKFLEKNNEISINENRIIIKSNNITTIRALLNIITREYRIYDNLIRYLSDL